MLIGMANALRQTKTSYPKTIKRKKISHLKLKCEIAQQILINQESCSTEPVKTQKTNSILYLESSERDAYSPQFQGQKNGDLGGL